MAQSNVRQQPVCAVSWQVGPSLLLEAAIILWTCAVTIPLVALLVGSRQADEFVAYSLVRPEVEARFGFSSARPANRDGGTTEGPIEITNVAPGGPFSTAGVEVGDRAAAGFRHGYHAAAFFFKLAQAQGGRVYLVFYRGEALSPVEAWIPVPPRAAPPNPSLQRTPFGRR